MRLDPPREIVMVASARASRRLALALALVPPLLLARGAAAQWIPDGVPVCTAPGNQSEHVIASDGAGGAFIAWSDAPPAPNSDVYLQHLTILGEVAAGCAVGGVLLCSAP